MYIKQKAAGSGKVRGLPHDDMEYSTSKTTIAQTDRRHPLKAFFYTIFAFFAIVSFMAFAADPKFDRDDPASVREFAEKGDPEAQYYLGLHCEIENNMAEAVKWYRKAADQDDLDAQYKLGVCYENGKGVSPDCKEAVKWYRKAAENGVIEAQIALGACYENGKGVSPDCKEAVKWYRNAADRNNTEAQYKLGFCYETGSEIRSEDKAAIWYRRAAEKGHAGAQYKIAQFYETGKGVEKNVNESIPWYVKAANQGNLDAQLRLGRYYSMVDSKGKPLDMAAAIRWYEKAAEQGYQDADLFITIGSCYENNDYVNRDVKEAFDWYRKAADLGSAEAQAKVKQYTKAIQQEEARQKKEKEVAARKARKEEAARIVREAETAMQDAWQYEEMSRASLEESIRRGDDEEEIARKRESQVEDWQRFLKKEKAWQEARKEAERILQGKVELKFAEPQEQETEATRKAREEAERKARDARHAEAADNALAQLIGNMTVKMSGGKATIAFSSGLNLEMIKVEAGTFKAGSDESPREVKLTKDYFIGQTEVTQAQWKAVMGYNPSEFVGDDLPVVTISWNEAMQFCENLNRTGEAPKGWKFMLPTVIQWEYAACGGNKSKGYTYSGSNNIDEVAWYMNNSSRTQPVGKKQANELGLYDMTGNVNEWCLDDWKEKRDEWKAEFSRKNDRGGKRVIRGGCWNYADYDCHTRRWDDNASYDYLPNNLGFRLALVPESY